MAERACISKHQQVQAIRVANVPAASFERQVESPKPPTVTALAEQGKKAALRPASIGEIKPHQRRAFPKMAGNSRSILADRIGVRPGVRHRGVEVRIVASPHPYDGPELHHSISAETV